MNHQSAYRFSFAGTTAEVITHVRWCRANLGVIGQEWDFASSRMGKNLDIWISNERNAVWYQLKFADVVKN